MEILEYKESVDMILRIFKIGLTDYSNNNISVTYKNISIGDGDIGI